MRNIYRFLSFVLAVVLCVTSFCYPVSATEDVLLQYDSDSYILDDYYMNEDTVTGDSEISEISSFIYDEYISENSIMDSSNVYESSDDLDEIEGMEFSDDVFYAEASASGGLWVDELEESYVYTGSAIKPDIKVYCDDILLKKNVHYTLSYKNNTNVNDASVNKSAPKIIIKGIGNFSGTATKTFKIEKRNLCMNESVSVNQIICAYNGSPQKPVPTVKWNGKELKYKRDFKVEYPEDSLAYKNYGLHKLRIKGKGNFYTYDALTGKDYIEVTFIVSGKVLLSKASISLPKKLNFTRSKITPKPSVYYKSGNKKIKLTEGEDYTVEYINNILPGKATVVIKAIDGSNCIGEKKAYFTIVGVPLSNAKITKVNKSYVYDGKAITPEPILVMKHLNFNVSLAPEFDYDVTYKNNINKGTATIYIKGKNGFTGTVKKTFKITPYDLSKDNKQRMEYGFIKEGEYISGNGILSTDYQKGGSKPVIYSKINVDGNFKLLKSNKDFSVTYKNNKKVASLDATNKPYALITGKGNFKGTKKLYFSIDKKNIGDLKLSVNDAVYTKKTGKVFKSPVIYDANGKKLVAGTDYGKKPVYTYAETGEIVGNKDIPPVNTLISVSVNGIKNYAGYISNTYRVVKADISKATITIPDQIYTGKEIKPNKHVFKAKFNGKTLEEDNFEVVEYKNNINKGTAKVVIRGINNFGGKKTVSFKIKAKKFGLINSGEDDKQLSLNVDYDQDGIKCGVPITFTMNPVNGSGEVGSTIELNGNSDTPRYKYIVNSINMMVDGVYAKEVDCSDFKYESINKFKYTFAASGKYKIRFYVMDYGTTPVSFAKKDLEIEINDSSYPCIEKIADDIVATVNGKNLKTQYEKALYLHDELLRRGTYDSDSGMLVDGDSFYIGNSVTPGSNHKGVWVGETGVLVRGKGTCESYCRAYEMLLKRMGIFNERVEGNGHEWTRVRLDGQWTVVDTTLDDFYVYPEEYSYLNHIYFGMTDEITQRIHSEYKSSETKLCNNFNNNFYLKSGKIKVLANSIREKVLDEVMKGIQGSYCDIKADYSQYPEVYKALNPVIAYYLNAELSGVNVEYVYDSSNIRNSYFRISATAKKGGIIKIPESSERYNPEGTNVYYVREDGSVATGFTDGKKEGIATNAQTWSFYFADEDMTVGGKSYRKGEAVGGYLGFDSDNKIVSRSDSYSASTPYYFDSKTGARRKILLYYHGGYYSNPIDNNQSSVMNSISNFAATDLEFGSTDGYMPSVIFATASEDYPRAASSQITYYETDSAGNTYSSGEAYGGNMYLFSEKPEKKRYYDPKNDYTNRIDVDSTRIMVQPAISDNRLVLNAVRGGDEVSYGLPHNVFETYNGKYIKTITETLKYKKAEGTTNPDGLINVFDVEVYTKATYRWAIQEYGAENVVLCGTSSGAGICLALLQWAAENDITGTGVRDIPSDTILISPWFDVSMAIVTESDKSRVGNGVDYGTLCYWGKIYARNHLGKTDPVVDLKSGKDSSNRYAVDYKFASPVSKANEDLNYNGLGNVTVYTGGKDACLGNAREFQSRCIGKEGTNLSFYSYANEPHGFVFGDNTMAGVVINDITKKMMKGL